MADQTPAPDLTAVDRALDAPPSDGGRAADKSLRAEIAQQMFLRDLRIGDDTREVAAESVRAADALIRALEGRR